MRTESLTALRRLFHDSLQMVLTLLIAAGCGSPPVDRSLQNSPNQAAVLSISNFPTYDFGSVLIGSSKQFVFAVTNIGTQIATNVTSNFYLSANFNYTGGNYPGTAGTCTDTIHPYEICDIEIKFTPLYPGLLSSVIAITYHNGITTSSTTDSFVQGRGQTP